MLTLVLAIQTISVMTFPIVPASRAQARKMPPAELADRLLQRGHPPIDHVEVPPVQVGSPPPPPGTSAVPEYDVVLETSPVRAVERGYCTRQRITVTVLNPEIKATIRLKEVAQLYRLDPVCSGGATNYGLYEDAAALSTIRTLERMRRGKLDVEYVDYLAPRFTDETFKDGISALRSIDFGRVWWAGPATSAGSLNELKRKVPENAETTAFYAGEWSGIAVRDHDRIVRVLLKRAMPAPF